MSRARPGVPKVWPPAAPGPAFAAVVADFRQPSAARVRMQTIVACDARMGQYGKARMNRWSAAICAGVGGSGMSPSVSDDDAVKQYAPRLQTAEPGAREKLGSVPTDRAVGAAPPCSPPPPLASPTWARAAA